MPTSEHRAGVPIAASLSTYPSPTGHLPNVVSTPIADIGRLLLALPMLAYPVLHFVYTDFVASIVPPWIPWHFFWTYFTALTIAAAGIAILANRRITYLAALLLGIEILLFVILIHLPLLFHRAGDPWASRAAFGDMPSRVINAFKDFGLAGAVLLFAGTQSRSWRNSRRDPLSALGLAIVSISVAAFGVLHFVFPAYAPGVPPMRIGVQFLLPPHDLWVYASAFALLVLAVAVWIPRYAQTAALILGATILGFDLVTWGPLFFSNPMELVGNWLKDVGIAAGAWILYGALRARTLAAINP